MSRKNQILDVQEFGGEESDEAGNDNLDQVEIKLPKTKPSPLTHVIPPFVLIDPLVSYLPVADVVNLASTTSRLGFLRHDEVTWRILQHRDFPRDGCSPLLDLFAQGNSAPSRTHYDPLSPMLAASAQSGGPSTSGSKHKDPAYQQYKILSIGYQIDQVRWAHQDGWQNVSPREGHDQCALADDRLFLRFGFTNDSSGWVLDPRGPVPSGLELHPPGGNNSTINGVYGHKISLVSTEWDKETGEVVGETLVQFGGSTAGGYRGMTSSLVVMTTNRREGTITDYILNIPHTLIPGRAYHAQHYDQSTKLLYVHGGLLEHGACDNKFYVLEISELLDLAKEAAQHNMAQLPAGHPDRRRIPAAIAACITELPIDVALEPRFGHSILAIAGGGGGDTKLYIAGGYTGSGMFSLMDGDDLTSLWEYNTRTQIHRCIVTRVGLDLFLGRCHGAVAYGPLLLYFGGTTEWSNVLTIFDTRTERLYRPSVDASGDRSGAVVGRTAHCMSRIGTKIYITGGCLRERPMFRPQVGDLAHCVTRALRQLNRSREVANPGVEREQEAGGETTWSPPMCTPISRLAEARPPPQDQQQQQRGLRFGARPFYRSEEEEDEGRDSVRRLLAALTAQGAMSREQAEVLLGRMITRMEQEQEEEEEETEEQEEGEDNEAGDQVD